MTRDQLKLPAWLWPIVLAALLSIGAARVTLSGKEDQSAHDRDVAETRKQHTADLVRQQGQVDSIRFDARLRDVRDSARWADAMRVLTDIQRQVKTR